VAVAVVVLVKLMPQDQAVRAVVVRAACLQLVLEEQLIQVAVVVVALFLVQI
jgi:hypothetical protein